MNIWKNGIMERLSELKSENLVSRLWEGLWERVMVEKWNCGIMAPDSYREE